jgi:hypothetical protein
MGHSLQQFEGTLAVRLLATAATALLVLASPASAQVRSKGAVSQRAVTPEAIEQRLQDSAESTRKMSASGAARSALIDFAWPQDKAEYLALGKYVVVLVNAVSQQADELPLKRVYVESNGREITLEKIGSIRREVPESSPVYAMLGRYREDAFYLAPAGTMMRKGTVMVDFAARRSGFRLYELPGTPPAFVKADRKPMPATGAKPDAAALKALVAREYPGFSLPAMVRAEVR